LIGGLRRQAIDCSIEQTHPRKGQRNCLAVPGAQPKACGDLWPHPYDRHPCAAGEANGTGRHIPRGASRPIHRNRQRGTSGKASESFTSSRHPAPGTAASYGGHTHRPQRGRCNLAVPRTGHQRGNVPVPMRGRQRHQSSVQKGINHGATWACRCDRAHSIHSPGHGEDTQHPSNDSSQEHGKTLSFPITP